MPNDGGASGGERVARKDRERARKRHAIQRARREGGYEPAPKAERPATRTQTRRPAPSGRAQAQPLQKAQVGDVDRKGRVYERPLLLHPKIALYIYFLVLAAGVGGLRRRGPTAQAVAYGAFAVGMLVTADSKTAWMRALPFILRDA